ncbi:hypothetical protein TRFO_27393 [Tritrichomonas foetus]|uniref:Uncharacterized protein n=1 Tax=Tritrichomonas foetus TaxID=1144522 RepID=A0A1J4K190_9EUKA|nr:hypothetical protein TRFO_27393 [Tritrichomonas foetus]|eukprot:OHT05003.1 hypothetical protein TRFO_27393 [Tritrichomonas foetus]
MNNLKKFFQKFVRLGKFRFVRKLHSPRQMNSKSQISSMKRRTGKRQSQNSSVNQLREMNDRSSRKQIVRKTVKSNDSDAILDMIDQRIGNLLLRSSELESKLDSIERNANSTVAPNFASSISRTMKIPPTSSSSAKKSTQRMKTETYSSTSENTTKAFNVKNSIIATPKTIPNTYKITNEKSEIQESGDISSLFRIVELLTKEVREMKTQQRMMSEQINTMHHQLIQHKFHSEDESQL